MNRDKDKLGKQEKDILIQLFQEPFINQRILAEEVGHSLGVINRSVKSLIQKDFLNEDLCLTDLALSLFKERHPQRAIILAAGFGMRMVPINTELPKAFLVVDGERLIERHIRHLHEAGIYEIHIVVGFMKERFEYLIDKYNVKLIVNSDYAIKNNLYSMKLVSDYLSNAYIVPCDIWCRKNPFNHNELYSWYMVSDLVDEESDVRINRKMELVRVGEDKAGNSMIGIAYIAEEDGFKIKQRIQELLVNKKNDGSYWEEALYQNDRMMVYANVVSSRDVVEVNTYEQLRDLDADSEHLKSDAIALIANVLQADEEEIVDISVLKKGMTNRSFVFSCKGTKYIMRIPGEGTDQLINRRQEAEVYKAISGKGLCDDPLYINPENGYKITKFLDNVRVCDTEEIKDLKRCMKKLKAFHDMKIQVNHSFDIFGQIEFYEELWNGQSSVYRDYEKTKENVFSLKEYVDRNCGEKVLTHIDAVPDNFLFYDCEGEEKLQLTDWEYSGMQDPHVDIAMFGIYSFFDKDQMDNLIDLYFEGKCAPQNRIKIYCYVSACGLLWSNWTEYKSTLGVEFGEYGLRQYRYAKDFYRYAIDGMDKFKLPLNYTVKDGVTNV